jgi:hypothetical protein
MAPVARGFATACALALTLSVPFGLAGAAPAAGPGGAALVIGQQGYAHAGQDDASHADAAAVASALAGAGWRVDTRADLSAVQLRGAVAQFAASLVPGEAALVYFSGLSAKAPATGGGVDNILLGVDAEAASPAALPACGIPFGLLIDLLDRRALPAMILILDAARPNVLEPRWGAAPGLAEPTSALLENAFVVYPAAPGHVAHEGEFVPELVKAIGRSALSVSRIMGGVSMIVDQDTGGDQVPWYSGSSASARWPLRSQNPGSSGGAGGAAAESAVFDQAVACGTERCLLDAAAILSDPLRAMDLRLRAAVAGAELAPARPVAAPARVPAYVESFIEANRGSAAGMGRIGQNYLHGANGFPSSAADAYPWLMRAATAGDPRSNYETALIFDTGAAPVGHVDKYAAAPLFKRAAEAGDPDAQYHLGLYYLDGQGGLPRDPGLGGQWLAKAAATRAAKVPTAP